MPQRTTYMPRCLVGVLPGRESDIFSTTFPLPKDSFAVSLSLPIALPYQESWISTEAARGLGSWDRSHSLDLDAYLANVAS